MKTRSLKRFHFSFKTFALLFLCVTLLTGLLPENVSAASSIGLSAYAPRPGSGTITISWNKVSNASFYAYSVRDTTTNASICDRTQTSKAYAKVSHTWEAGHSYRVWAGACCEGNDPDNTSTWDYTGMTTFTVEACAHSNTDIAWDTSYSITYTSVSDTQHKMKGYQYEYCTSCFEHIGSSYKVTETVGHDFDKNGDCPSCGYTHACAHTKTKLVEIDGYPAYIQDSETKHIVDIQYKRVCRDCDAVVDKLVDSERVYQREDHDFNSKGVCRDCGYVKPAQQEPLKISVSASPSSAETGATLSASATASGGDGNYSFSWKVTCDGSVVVNTDLSYGSYYSYTASKAGSYVFTATVRDGNGNQVSASSGTLTVKAPACQHPSTEIAWDTSRTITYKSVSDQEHTMTGYQYKYCTVCFERVGDSFSASETVSHDFDSNGDCPSCGYTHACPHTRTNLVALDGYPAYRPDSETQHIVDIQYKEVCSDCNAVVNKLVDSARVYKREDHNFNENGTCRSCGYVKPAQQEPLKISVSASPSSAETGASLSASATASGGDGNYSFSWKVTCDGNVVANTDLSYGSTYNHTASKAGSYVFTATVRDGNGNQVSASSGAITVKAPAHVHNYKENIIKRSNYVNQNENEHDVTVTYTMKCDGCGDETARKTKTVRAAHAYTSKGHIEGKHQDGKGHATFDRCACGAAKYTGYAKYGNCCTCYGHAWGNPYTDNNRWMHKCARCGVCSETSAPTQDICDHAEKQQEVLTKYTPHDDKTHMEQVEVLYSCDCGKNTHSKIEFAFLNHSLVDGICTVCGYDINELTTDITNHFDDINDGIDTDSWKRYAKSASKLLDGPHFKTATTIFGYDIDVINEDDDKAMIDAWKFYLGKTLSGYEDCLADCFDSNNLQSLKSYVGSLSGPVEATSETLTAINGIFDILKKSDIKSSSVSKIIKDSADAIEFAGLAAESIGDFLDVVDVWFSKELVAKENAEMLDVLYNTAIEYASNKEKIEGIMSSTNDPQLIQACKEVLSEMKSFYCDDIDEIARIRTEMTSKEIRTAGKAVQGLLVDKIIEEVSPVHATEHLAGALINAKIQDEKLYTSAANLYKISLLDQNIYDDAMTSISQHQAGSRYISELYTVIQIYGSAASMNYIDDYNYTTMKSTSTGLSKTEIRERKNSLLSKLDETLRLQKRLYNAAN